MRKTGKRRASKTIVLTRDELAAFGEAVIAQAFSRMEAENRLLRREGVVTTGELAINFGTYEATVRGQVLKLKPREFATLAALARNVGQVLTREQLLSLAWPNAEEIENPQTVDTHVCRLRSKLRAVSPDAGALIETLYGGVGYRLRREAVTQTV